MTRAATSAELAAMRSDGMFGRLYAIFDEPEVVYQCQVNQTFGTHDKIAQVSYDNASGALLSVVYGMTVYVGTTPGTWDVGVARVRKPWTMDTAYIGETSEIAWADNLYLTVVDEFSVWPRHLRVHADGTTWMDYDVPYSNQHNAFAPVPCLGVDRVVKLTGTSLDVALDATQSWVINGSISGYSWEIISAAGASLIGASTGTPTLTVTQAGRVTVACTVTASNGKTSTGYRNVYVWDDDHPPAEIVLESFSGSTERGGFELNIRLAQPKTIRNMQKVILFSDESTPVSPNAGAENIVAVGWIDEANCTLDASGGDAVIAVKGAHYWLDKISGYPSGIESSMGTPSKWTQIQDLTVDKMLYHLLYWRTTVTNCCDVYLTGDTRTATAINAATGSLWRQIQMIAQETILATPICDPFGRLYVQVDANYLPTEDRSAIPVIETLTDNDYRSVSIVYRATRNISRLELSGMAGKTSLFSLAPGHVFSRTGAVIQRDRILLASQQQANILAGLIMARENRAYDFEISLAAANRLITLAPRQYITLTIQSGDTPAGILYSGNVIPREININHNPDTGAFDVSITAEPETFGDLNVNGDVPLNDDSGDTWKPPSFPPPPLPPLPPLPGPLPTSTPRFALLLTSDGLYWTETLDLYSPIWIGLNEGFEEQDYTNGFIDMGCNQNGKYYVASRYQLYSGMTGYPAQLIKSRDDLESDIPPDPIWGTPASIQALGVNPVADEVAFIAGQVYPASKSYYFYGITSKTLLSLYVNDRGNLSWGKSGVLATYVTGVGFDRAVARFSLGAAVEDYHAYIPGPTFSFYHVRPPDGIGDRVLCYYPAPNAVNSSVFLVNNGETISSLTTNALSAAAFGNDYNKILGVIGQNPYKSTNAGIDWTPLSWPKLNADNSSIVALDDDRWVWAVRGWRLLEQPSVLYTPDFGETFVDKTGNLMDVSSGDFRAIRLKVFP